MKPTKKDNENEDDDQWESMQDTIQQLLNLCAENEISVPKELKEKFLYGKALRQEAFSNHTEYLKQKKIEEKLLSSSLMNDEIAQHILDIVKKLKLSMPHLHVIIKNGSYKVTKYIEKNPFDTLNNKNKNKNDKNDIEEQVTIQSQPKRATQKIHTVHTESPIVKLFQLFFSCVVHRGAIGKVKKEKIIMDGINLVLEQGKMYLVLGAPGSGKSTLLKMIANTLLKSKDCKVGGEVTLSGLSPNDKGIWWSNLVGYIDQIDRMHPFMTVYETCIFAWMCRSGSTHHMAFHGTGPEVMQHVTQMDSEQFLVKKILDILGLTSVNNTFVGDQTKVRGVSGGEKKRVTVAEMFVIRTPIMCCDEISTGLDAATTYDITRAMGIAARITKTTKVVALLQTAPETVANFDELILLSDGLIIYSGPIEDVEEYFNSLGYFIPKYMDVADWLQALPTSDGWKFLTDLKEDGIDPNELKKKHLSSQEFHEKFYSSDHGLSILERINVPVSECGEVLKEFASRRYRSTAIDSLRLVVRRELLLWWRDKYQIRAKVIQTIIMAIVVGTLFFQGDPESIVSVLFQSMFYTVIGAMVQVPKQFPDRSILYKHQDANFFPTWCYIVGRGIASIPTALIDGVGYGTIVFFLSGMSYNDGASIANYFVFILMMFVTSFASGLFFSMYSACAPVVTLAQAAMSLTAIIFVVFSGFTVQPDVIPVYYIWIYYLNYFAWMFRGFMVNEFVSGRYGQDGGTLNGTPVTKGELILVRFGFTNNDDEPYTYIWAWWGILFTLGSAALAAICTLLILSKVRYSSGKSLVDEQGDDIIEVIPDSDIVQLPFTKVDLTFKDMHYTVTSSITKEQLELLKGVDGVVEAGKMTALMGSSGAGKTTLMDVLAMRKNTGVITGEIRLNGHLQEETSFRRCMGYVEQFDVQTSQLTIKETCEFSAKLRLEESDPAVTPESISKFVQQALNMLELTNIQDLQVGTDEEGGLSFEQRKRMSIAIELVANPSILFLDEPTSGLDARAAASVMRGLKRVALSGRAVCATIHQPSIDIVNKFDSLLVLKKGGEVVFFGETGENSSKLIEYLERYDTTPKIQPGENPATWMLSTVGTGRSSSDSKTLHYADSYCKSRLHSNCLEKIDSIAEKATDDNVVYFRSKYATSSTTQSTTVFFRTMKVYFRAPSYNTTRVTVSAIVAFLFATVYASQQVPENESDMNSRMNSLFIAVIFLCVNALNTVLDLFENERNMFYRHKASNMYDSNAIITAFTLAEIPFILLTATVFAVPFYFLLGFKAEVDKFFIFYLFVLEGFSIFTFTGQMLVALFLDSQTAQGFGGLVVTFTSLFSGVLIRPDSIPDFWIFMYWIMPGHYIYEGIFMSQFSGDTTPIEAASDSKFHTFLECSEEPCIGTAEQWIDANFPDFSKGNIPGNAVYLFFLIVLTRIITYHALTNINHKKN